MYAFKVAWESTLPARIILDVKERANRTPKQTENTQFASLLSK